MPSNSRRALGVGPVGALEDALRADVDPGPGGHLAVHDEALAGEFVEVLLRRPVGDEVGVGDEDARERPRAFDDADGLAALDEEEGLVGPRRRSVSTMASNASRSAPLPAPAVDDEAVGVFGDLRVEVVHEHAEPRFGLPGLQVRCMPRGAWTTLATEAVLAVSRTAGLMVGPSLRGRRVFTHNPKTRRVSQTR